MSNHLDGIKFSDQELKGSLLPMIIGEKDEIHEVIFCESISGGAKYQDDMPKELTLVRRTKEGKEWKRKYVQAIVQPDFPKATLKTDVPKIIK